MEHFVFSCDTNKCEDVSVTLNLNLLQQVRVGDAPSVWVFSSQTVESIESLYVRYGPGWFDQHMPSWATTRVLGQVVLWEWIILLLMLIVCVVLNMVVKRILRFTFSHVRLVLLREFGHILALPAAFMISLTKF
ncbi:MAG: hypothetical protein GFH27_549303n233 [Chloroflexi bacterium AL-W]|nr:hypothetical protein [Chloroflexi bacterium AL-N1]NOK68118.1 hypothetical protein [Chloroflexi bacterium AL-N10]NOK73458.1 hypothetical protein [Chloroflexi bacterium AL-N5]NOK83372.1 hypothetical protein [Chloroflexi bacterium AL-W]NOK87789.1 hypothetical protein [Chloroflexi bacterium AL-N15]